MWKVRLVFAVVSIACVLPRSRTYTIQNELSLHTALFPTTYDPHVRPGTDRTNPLQINVTFYLFSIKEFDETISKFSITGGLAVSWIDDRLTWDPTNYGGIEVTVVPQKKLWIPYLVNMLDYNSLSEIGHQNMNVRVEKDGQVNWVTPNLFESTCDADLSYYPFDTQTCTLRFFIPGYLPSEIVFMISEQMYMSEFSANSLWKVTETKLFTFTNTLLLQEARMAITMRRRPVYYISSLILPVAFLSFLQLCVFLMPPDCGERVGFVVTVLLAIAVYLTLVQDKLPEGSEPSVSFLSYKLLGDFMVGVFMVVGVVIGLRFYQREEDKPIPNYLQTFHRISLCDCFCYRRKRKVHFDEGDTVKDVTLDPVTEILTWRDIGIATDRFCLKVFGFCLMNCNILYLIVLAILA
ncbi:neuronal acetylcholine receptor subunit alpha-6-like [Saccostrea cucullata]|uniref:neuronal acetylcholine receptor subunit alpha-6-like n=1 Tax=Saccostrea cuccullata TaxID=36930 RepID=UPI002ED60337